MGTEPFRLEHVKCGVRKIFAFSGSRPAPVSNGVRRNPLADELGAGPQADDPAGRPTRARGRSELLATDRPLPADGPRHPPSNPDRSDVLTGGQKLIKPEIGTAVRGGVQLYYLAELNTISYEGIPLYEGVTDMDSTRGPLHADRICRPPWGRQSRQSLLRIQLQRVKDAGL
jgi:hypothetical protein